MSQSSEQTVSFTLPRTRVPGLAGKTEGVRRVEAEFLPYESIRIAEVRRARPQIRGCCSMQCGRIRLRPGPPPFGRSILEVRRPETLLPPVLFVGAAERRHFECPGRRLRVGTKLANPGHPASPVPCPDPSTIRPGVAVARSDAETQPRSGKALIPWRCVKPSRDGSVCP